MVACDWLVTASLLQRFLQSESSTPKLMREPNATVLRDLLRLNLDMGLSSEASRADGDLNRTLSPKISLSQTSVSMVRLSGSSGP